MNAEAPVKTKRRPARKWRTWWMQQLHTWHYISAALSLVCMLGFAITGITLNHAASIDAAPKVTHRTARLDASLLPQLAGAKAKDVPLPAAVAARVAALTGLDPAGRSVEWSDEEAYVAMPRPGGDAWVSIGRTSGAIESEVTDRGWISYLNDLHKGRNAGSAWFWFIDVFALACIVFTITGLLLLQILARNRRLTWPLVGIGFVLPVALALFFIH